MSTRSTQSVHGGDRGLCEAGRQGEQHLAACQSSRHTEVKDYGADQHERRAELVFLLSFIPTTITLLYL